jgi:hypothetical protein
LNLWDARVRLSRGTADSRKCGAVPAAPRTYADFFEAKKAGSRNDKRYLTSSIAGLSVVGKNSSINHINEKLKSFDLDGREQRQAMLIELVKDVCRTSPIEGS